jgi:hypothetical protein
LAFVSKAHNGSHVHRSRLIKDGPANVSRWLITRHVFPRAAHVVLCPETVGHRRLINIDFRRNRNAIVGFRCLCVGQRANDKDQKYPGRRLKKKMSHVRSFNKLLLRLIDLTICTLHRELARLPELHSEKFIRSGGDDNEPAVSVVNRLWAHASSRMATVQLRLRQPFHASRADSGVRAAAYHRVMGSRKLFVQELYGFFRALAEPHLVNSSIASAFYRFTEGVWLVSPAVLLGLFFVREMIIELSTPHATCVPCATRRFGSGKCVPSECSCPSAVVALSRTMLSTGVRLC